MALQQVQSDLEELRTTMLQAIRTIVDEKLTDRVKHVVEEALAELRDDSLSRGVGTKSESSAGCLQAIRTIIDSKLKDKVKHMVAEALAELREDWPSRAAGMQASPDGKKSEPSAGFTLPDLTMLDEKLAHVCDKVQGFGTLTLNFAAEITMLKGQVKAVEERCGQMLELAEVIQDSSTKMHATSSAQNDELCKLKLHMEELVIDATRIEGDRRCPNALVCKVRPDDSVQSPVVPFFAYEFPTHLHRVNPRYSESPASTRCNSEDRSKAHQLLASPDRTKSSHPGSPASNRRSSKEHRSAHGCLAEQIYPQSPPTLTSSRRSLPPNSWASRSSRTLSLPTGSQEPFLPIS